MAYPEYHASRDQPANWKSCVGGILRLAGAMFIALGAAGFMTPCEAVGEDHDFHNGSDQPPLWQLAIERMQAHGGYVAGRVETEMKVFDGREKFLGSMTEVEEMERLGTRLRWLTHSKTTEGSPGMTIKADFGLQSDPASALKGYDKWQRRSRGNFDAQPVEVWEGVDSADPENGIIAFIDPVSGSLRKAVFTLPFRTPVGSVLVKGELVCEQQPQGVWLPSQITMDQTGRLLFTRRHLHIVKKYEEWQSKVTVPGDP